MKKILAIAFILTCISHGRTNAQTFKYNFSESTAHIGLEGDAVPVDDGWLVLNRSYEKKLYSQVIIVEIARYDKKMQKTSATVITLKEDKDVLLKGLYSAKGQYNLIYGYKANRKDNEVLISGIRINPKDLSVMGEVSLGSVRARNLGLFSEVKFDPKSFVFDYSIDSSRFYLLTYPEQNKKDAKQFSFAVFNADLSKVYGKDIELDIQSRYAEIESTTLDQDANFFIQRRTIPVEISSSYIDKENDKYIPEESILTHYSKVNMAGTDVKIGLTGKYVYQTKIVANKASNKLDIAGTYKNLEKGKISGVFYCHYDPATKKTDGLISSEIAPDVLDALANEKLAKASGKDPGLSLAFTIQKVSYRANGSVDCIMEFENALEATKTGFQNKWVDYIRYYNNSILNANITKDGKMNYTRIPKKQMNNDKNSFMSFFSFYSGNNLVYLYNDSKKNVEKDIAKTPATVEPDERGTVLVAAILDEKGNLRREIVYEHDEDNYVTVPRASRMVSGNDVLLRKSKFGAVIAIESNKIGLMHVQ